MKRIFTLLWLILPGYALAGSEASLDAKPMVANLMPSPGRCELKAGQKHCQMQLNLIWEAPTEARYCLWRKGGTAPIKCWERAWRGNVQVNFNSAQKTWFELKNSHSDAVLAKTDVSVTGSYKQRKRAQRRKRGIWRMF